MSRAINVVMSRAINVCSLTGQPQGLPLQNNVFRRGGSYTLPVFTDFMYRQILGRGLS